MNEWRKQNERNVDVDDIECDLNFKNSKGCSLFLQSAEIKSVTNWGMNGKRASHSIPAHRGTNVMNIA